MQGGRRHALTELEDEATGGGRLAGIDVPADDDRDVLLAVRHGCSCSTRGGGEENERSREKKNTEKKKEEKNVAVNATEPRLIENSTQPARELT
jgi:hypothetical protein